MYALYFYSDYHMKRTTSQYGYWTGKSYKHDELLFPVFSTALNGLDKKWYKSLKRAIIGGKKACENYGYVTGFDVEDVNGNIVYRSCESTDAMDKSNRNSHTSKEVYDIPVIKTENTVNKKIEMLIDKYQSRLDDLEVLTEFTFEDGKREVLKSVIADLQSIME